MKKYNQIDLMKFLCAILIIILHTNPFGSFSRAINFGFRNIICTVAVPLFFISSGFLFAVKTDGIQDSKQRGDYVKKFSLRLILLYVIWSLIYLAFVIINWFRKGFEAYFILKYVKDFFSKGSYQTIWFLPALLVAQLVVYFLHKKLSYEKIFVLCIPIYLFTLLASSYYGVITERVEFLKVTVDLYYSIFDTIKNGILFGMIFVTIGGIFSDKKSVLKLKADIILIIVFWGLLAGEQLFLSKFNVRGIDTVIAICPLSFFIFDFVLKIRLKDSNIWYALRKYSMLMFLCQRIPLSVIEMFMSGSIIYTNTMLFFIVVLSSTLLISFVIIMLSKKIKLLNYFY